MAEYVAVSNEGELPHLLNLDQIEDLQVVNRSGQLFVLVVYPTRRCFDLKGEHAARVLDAFGLAAWSEKIRSGEPQKSLQVAKAPPGGFPKNNGKAGA